MICKPTPLSAILVCFSLIVTLFIAPLEVYPLPPVWTLLVGLLNKDLRRSSKPYLKMIVVASSLLSLITVASIIGGASLQAAIIPSIRSLGLIYVTTVSIHFCYISTEPSYWLFILNVARIPKTVIYILLSSITSMILIKDNGIKTISLLRLKGYSFKSIRSKFSAYIRIISPLFSVLLSNLQIQARSLHYRGFFESRDDVKCEPRWNQPQVTWLLIALSNISLAILAAVWI